MSLSSNRTNKDSYLSRQLDFLMTISLLCPEQD